MKPTDYNYVRAYTQIETALIALNDAQLVIDKLNKDGGEQFNKAKRPLYRWMKQLNDKIKIK